MPSRSVRSPATRSPARESLGHGRVSLAWYAWVAALAPGRRVLDLGCGTGAGSRLLAEAGAAEVLGVEEAEALLGLAGRDLPAAVRLIHEDPARVDLEPGAYGLITCFGLSGGDWATLAVRLVESLNAEGVLALDSNSDAAVRDLLPEVRLQQEYRWEARSLASAPDEDGEVMQLSRGTPGTAVVLASRAPLAELPGAVVLADVPSPSAPAPNDSAVWLRDAEERRRELARQLVETETRLAELVELERRVAELSAQRHESDHHRARAIAALESIQGSPSWRATGFLRRGKKALRGLLKG